MFDPQLRFFTLLCSLLLGSAAQAQTIYVDDDLTTGANDGSSWANAYQGSSGLQTAIGAATSGQNIFVAEGLYLPTTGSSRSVSFALKNGVEIYGGFVGTEADPSERPPFGTAPSILSGDLNGDDGANMTLENSFHVVNGAGTNSSAVLDGFRITGGNANSGSSPNDRGAGILCVSGSSPDIRNCRFVENRCTFGGGAGYINASRPRFFDCSFEDNNGGVFGGAFDIAFAQPALFSRCRFTGNRAQRAGALEIFSTNNVLVFNCIFEDNLATGTGGGGAMWMGGSGATRIRHSTFVGNMASSNAVGGVRLDGASATIVSSILWNNSGPGGSMASNNQTNMLMNVTYSLIQGGLAGTGNISAGPKFVNQAGGDYHLDLNSPAIDAGDNAEVPGGGLVDYDGNPRFVDDPTVPDTGNGTAPIVDMGAFEAQPSSGLGTPYCFGDGSGSACPCGNTGGAGEGCATTTGAGITLALSGTASIAADDLVLTADGVPVGNTGIFYAGQTLLAGNPLFDGLQCVGGSTLRFQGQLAMTSTVSDTNLVAQDLFGLFWTPGTTYGFQYFTRDNQTGASPCSGFANLSHGVSLVMMP